MADTVDSAKEFDVPFGSDFQWLRFWLYAALHSNKVKGYNKKFKTHPSQNKIDETKGFVVTGTKLVEQGESYVNLDWVVKVVKTNAGYHLTADNELAKEFLGLLHGLCPAAADSGVGARGYNISARSEEYSFNQEHIRKMLSNFDDVNGYKKLTDKLEKEINNKVEELKELTDFEKKTDDELRAEAVKQISKAFTYDIQRGNEKLTVTYYKTGTLLTSTNNRELAAAFWQTFLDNCPEK